MLVHLILISTRMKYRVIEMRRVTNFIVKYRIPLLTIFILLSFFCVFLSTKVNINEDMLKYLPKTSETKQGKDIMEDVFPKQDSSVLNVMFKDLSNKDKMLDDLKNIKGVESVDYDNTDTYNKDKYTLYVLNVDDYADSKLAKNIYDTIKETYKPEAMSGSIADENKPLLQLWVIILAIVCAMIILVILSESYVEPFLYLISIGIAVFINKGTNIFFPSISNITNSIVAILQLALSMDYSIMLSNRYKQEKQNYAKKEDAMKEALYHSFSAISSSSVTTIVGLLALIFMSFTIGKDLGLVLAKGVLLSLVSIFFCLPALLLIFDDLIKKTKKRSPKFNLTKLGKFCYKTRHIQAIIILIVFIVVFFLKGNVNITYTGSEQDKVGRVFPANNQIAIVYKNKYENEIADYCKKLENDKKIDKVLCYSNTINEKLTYDKLNDKFNYLGQNTSIDNELIKIIYYDYYNKGLSNKMSLNEFISFITNDIASNSKFSTSLDNNILTNLRKLESFTNKDIINKKMDASNLAKVFDLDTDSVNKLFMLYRVSSVSDSKLTINEFSNTALSLANKEEYKSIFNKETLSKLEMLNMLSNDNIINQELDKTNMKNSLARLGINLDDNTINLLYMVYTGETTSHKLSLSEFASQALVLANYDSFKSYLSDETITSLNKIVSLSKISNIKMDNTHLYQVFNINENMQPVLNKVITGDITGIYYMTPLEFVNTLISSEMISSNLSTDTLASLNTAKFIMSNVDTKFSNTEIATYLNTNKLVTSVIFGSVEEPKNISIKNLINLIYSNKDNRVISSKLGDKSDLLNTAYLITNNTKTKLSVGDLSKLLNLDMSTVNKIYGLYDYQTKETTLSPYELTNLILNNKDRFNEEELTKIEVINKVMNDTLKDVRYTSNDTYETLKVLSKDTNKSLIDLVYLYYGSVNEYNSLYTLTVEEFVNYLNDSILVDERFTNFIEDSKREEIKDAKKAISKAKDLLVSKDYSRVVLNTKYTSEGKDVFKFINDTENEIGNKDGVYVVSNSSMAVEESKTFNVELNKITILTIMFIFIVVALTFKDLIIPAVLVLMIQCAVYVTMAAISISGGSVYFISVLIVQAILMGATIDYAIVYTSYYLESRKEKGILDSIINAYNKSIHTILSSSSILIIVTLVVANFASAIAARICETISEGTFAAVILILFVLPGVLASCDKFVCRKGYYREKRKDKKKKKIKKIELE